MSPLGFGINRTLFCVDNEPNRKVVEMSFEDYKKAQKAGQKSYHAKVLAGQYPYLPSLSYMLPAGEVLKEVRLGLVQIPMDQIAGTYTEARQNAFAPNFMPLLEPDTEFGIKWSALCDAHLEEGIHDAIAAYEYMNRFYVQEGNKRVSVMKYFGAVNIPGTVIRIMPKRTEEKENKIYYEFVDFYELSQINYLFFSQTGRFEKLQMLLFGDPAHVWQDEEKEIFYSLYYRFRSVYEAKGGMKLPITVGDALLSYIDVYGYDAIKDKLPAQMKEDLGKIWSEFVILQEEQPVERVLEPVEKAPSKNLISRIIPSGPKKLKIAFVNDKTAETSSWTYAHELGRQHLDAVFDKQVETTAYNEALTDGRAEEIIEQAIGDGYKVIFTTTPQLVPASLKAAVDHPEVRIFNCSLNITHSYIRTYYARLHEAKFLTGIIAGALADDNRIGYIADYPIYGMAANINAFALGAAMSNPRARIYLKWSTIQDSHPVEEFKQEGIHLVSGQDMITPESGNRAFGLFRLDEHITNVATAVTDWGQLYERLVKNILNVGVTKDEPSDVKKSLNYWWGLDAGVVDVIASTKLSTGTMRLIELVKRTISDGSFHAFEGELYAQGGMMVNKEGVMTPEQLVHMDWLADNIEGHIPSLSELRSEARPIVALQGLDDTRE
jgi:basic membrane lipoprotein Med (substrate-binding protein (PBP1-ABC) superfamily)